MLISIALAFVLHPVVSLPAAAAALSAQQVPAPAAQKTAEQPWPPAGVHRIGKEVTAPRLLKDVKPRYNADARDAKIEGAVFMEAVVKADGTVGDVRVTRSLDREHGLDDEAVASLKKWLFAPGKQDGTAVPVLVEVEMTFSLRDKR